MGRFELNIFSLQLIYHHLLSQSLMIKILLVSTAITVLPIIASRFQCPPRNLDDQCLYFPRLSSLTTKFSSYLTNGFKVVLIHDPLRSRSIGRNRASLSSLPIPKICSTSHS